MALYSWVSPPSTRRGLNLLGRQHRVESANGLRPALGSKQHNVPLRKSRLEGPGARVDSEGCRIPRTHQQRVVVVDGLALDVDHCARPVRPQVHLQKRMNSVKL